MAARDAVARSRQMDRDKGVLPTKIWYDALRSSPRENEITSVDRDNAFDSSKSLAK